MQSFSSLLILFQSYSIVYRDKYFWSDRLVQSLSSLLILLHFFSDKKFDSILGTIKLGYQFLTFVCDT